MRSEDDAQGLITTFCIFKFYARHNNKMLYHFMGALAIANCELLSDLVTCTAACTAYYRRKCVLASKPSNVSH